VVHCESLLYLVFEYLDLDMKKHFDNNPGLSQNRTVVKVRARAARARTPGGAGTAGRRATAPPDRAVAACPAFQELQTGHVWEAALAARNASPSRSNSCARY